MNRSDAKHKRMQVMLENSATYSDVEFQVGPDGESFFGLKAIYARASEVFSKMFFEAGFREQHETSPRVVVKVEDIMPKSFRQLHRWVYDMDVTLTWDTVFGILDAARKYMVEDLELQCRRWVALEAREAAGAVGLFSAAAAGQWFQWSQALRSRVESFGAAALAACPEATRQLPTDTFMTLLTSEDLCVEKEEEVFEAVQAWAAAANERGEDPAAVWQKMAESDVIHFPLLDVRFFAENVVLQNRLTQEQSLVVFVSKAMGSYPARQASLLARLQLILRDCSAEDATSIIDTILELRQENTYPQTLAHCLVQKALADYEHCSEWVSMWTELWGALRAEGLRDECVRATVDYCQNLFEEDPSPENLIGVWICPYDTLGLVRVLCKLNDSRKLAVLPLIKVLEALVRKAEESAPQGGCTCDPVSAATELAAHLDKIRSRNGHLTALQNLRSLQQRLEAMSGHRKEEMLSPDHREASASPRS
ncbi:btbd6a [Symbiodinium necroappetens]|uniref:Btbd6a protein n=1 Tax=Symbiodinium necroappetens TaxID=1628268 RepID=A0A813BYU8_9DINO|nr:btbd6a [Symbiodinium microadriaticum]CAE7607672.1 btbd6a [Symbiodinium sp. KB8]CAE7923512.1 btbd6a [Symbiodinium necroappetens]